MAFGTTAAILGGSLIAGGASVYGANKAAKAAGKGADAAAAEQARQFNLVRRDTAPQRELGRSAVGTISRLYGYGPGVMDDRQVGTRVLKPSEVESFLKQGMSVDDILKIGVFEPGAKTSDINTLMSRYSLSPDDVNRLQNGTFSPLSPAAGGGAGKPDMSVFFASPDYQFRQQEGQKAVDRMAAARGRFGSGAALKAGTQYASNLAAGEFGAFVDRLYQQAGIGSTGIGQSAAAGAQAASNIGAAYMNAGNARASSYMSAAQGINNAAQGGIQNYMLQNYLRGGGYGASAPVAFGGP